MTPSLVKALSVLVIFSYVCPISYCAEMTVYAIGVGQGDSNIIVCPNGKDILIVAMGATRPIYVEKSYGTYLLKEKFGAVENDMNIHILVSHCHINHYSFIKSAIDEELTPLVSEVVLGGQYSNYGKSFQTWLSTNVNKVYSVNNEQSCFGNTDCEWTPINSVNAKTINGTIFSIARKKHEPLAVLWQGSRHNCSWSKYWYHSQL